MAGRWLAVFHAHIDIRYLDEFEAGCRQTFFHIGVGMGEALVRADHIGTAGEYFLVHARRLLTNLKDAEDTIARLRGVQTGRLVVGVLSTAKYFMISSACICATTTCGPTASRRRITRT